MTLKNTQAQSQTNRLGAPSNGSTSLVTSRVASVMKPDSDYYRNRLVDIEMGKTGARELLPQVASALNVDPLAADFPLRMNAWLRETKVPLGELLEDMDPSDNYTGQFRDMDAFQRQLALADIRTKSVPSKGLYAHQLGRFFQSNVPGSQVLFPEYVDRVLREGMITPGILDYLIAGTTNIVGDVYATIYANETVDQRRVKRVVQGAELPKTTLATAEHAVRLFKYGRVLEATYEFFDTVSIDLFSVLLRRIAMQLELDTSLAAVEILVNGDGNSNAAVVHNQSVLDTGTTPTFTAYVAFAMKFFPYQLNTLVGNATSLIKFLTMTYPNVNPLAVLDFLQGGDTNLKKVRMPQNFIGAVDLIFLPDYVGNTLVGLDRRFALQHVVNNNMTLVETDKFITSQRTALAISQKDGFAKIFTEASRVWAWDQ